MAESSNLFRSPLLMQAEHSAILIVDMQEKLYPVITNRDAIFRKIVLLVKGGRLLNLPMLFTEQYPQGLGATLPEIMAEVRTVPPLEKCTGSQLLRSEKTMFSCRQCEAEIDALKSAGIKNLVLAGIETHVCMAQSALDLMANGFNVSVCVDATGSRKPLDHEVALRRLENSGINLTTVEAVLFEWCVDAKSDAFKQLSAAIKAT